MKVTTTLAWVTILVGVVSLVAATRGRRGPLVSPFSTCMFVLVSVFGIRPVLMAADDQFVFYGIDVRDGFDKATQIGLLAVVCLAGAYFTYGTRTVRSVDVVDAEPTLSIERSAKIGLVLTGLWLAAMAAAGGGVGFVTVLFTGRNAATRAAIEGLPNLISALPTAAAVLVSATRIETQRHRPLTRSETTWFWLTTAVTLLPPLALGTRRFLLPSVIAVALAICVPKWRQRVPLRTAALGVLSFLVLIAIPFVRSTGSRTGRTDVVGAIGDFFGREGLSGALNRYFLSYDTEMFGYVSLLSSRLGSQIRYGHGRWLFGDLALSPLPHGLVTKLGTQLRSDEILTQTFGTSCLRGVCPVPSLPGVLLSDFGVIGVGLGMIAVGFLCARFEREMPRSRGTRLLFLLTVGSFAPVLIRGNSPNLLWISMNVFLIALAAWKIQERTMSRLATTGVRPTAIGANAFDVPPRPREPLVSLDLRAGSSAEVELPSSGLSLVVEREGVPPPDPAAVPPAEQEPIEQELVELSSQGRRPRRALPWGIIDQILSSATNSAVIVVASHRLSSRGLGLVGIAITIALIAISASRAWTSSPLVLDHAAEDSLTRTRSLGASLLGSLRLSIAASLVTLGVAFVVSDDMRPLMIWLAIGMTALVIQDLTRYAFFVTGPSWGASASDLTWLLTFLGPAILMPDRFDQPAEILGLWLIGAINGLALSLAVIASTAPKAMRVDRRDRWLGLHSRLSLNVLGDTALVSLYGFSIPLILVVAAEVSDAGSYRLAQTIVGPLLVLISGMNLELLPRLVRRSRAGERIAATAFRFGATIAAICLAGMLVLLVVPDSLMTTLIGVNWTDAAGVTVVLAASAIFTGLVGSALIVIRAHGDQASVTGLRAMLFPLQLALVVVGAVIGGAMGASVGLLLGNVVSVWPWWRLARRAEARLAWGESLFDS